MRLRVGFDGRCLTSPAGGVRRYTNELFNAIARQDEIELVAVDAAAEAELPSRASRLTVSRFAPTNLGRALVDLPLAARRTVLDVFHAPAYTAPLWGVHPLVLTIHDASYIRHPEWYPYRRDSFRRAFYRHSALAADVIITDSQFSRREIAAAFGIDADRIAVIPLGVGGPFRADTTVAAPLPDVVRQPFVLHVGDLHPRRNLPVGLDAVLKVRSRRPECSSLQFVLAGTDRGALQRLRQQAAAAGHPDAIVFLGAPSDTTLRVLYGAAAVLLYPSRYEGFGLPLLEAMACGVPVVAARAGATPEVVGSAGLLVDPDDTEGFAGSLEAVLLSTERSQERRALSLRHAGQFSWERTAAATVEVYRGCMTTRTNVALS